MLGKRFLQLAWLHVIQAGVYRSRKSAAHHACQQVPGARQVLEHVICEDMQLAVEERPPPWIVTHVSEESQDEEGNDI